MEYSVSEAEEMLQKLSSPYTQQNVPWTAPHPRKKELDLKAIGEQSISQIMQPTSPMSERISTSKYVDQSRGTPISALRIAALEETLERTPPPIQFGEIGPEDIDPPGMGENTNFMEDLQQAAELSQQKPFSSRVRDVGKISDNGHQNRSPFREIMGNAFYNQEYPYRDKETDSLFEFMNSMRGRGDVFKGEETALKLNDLENIFLGKGGMEITDEEMVQVSDTGDELPGRGKSNKKMFIALQELYFIYFIF